MKEKENEFGQSVLKVIIVLRLGNFTLISEKKDVMTMLFDFHLPTQNWVYPATVSTSFCDQNYVMILFWEYHVDIFLFMSLARAIAIYFCHLRVQLPYIYVT